MLKTILSFIDHYKKGIRAAKLYVINENLDIVCFMYGNILSIKHKSSTNSYTGIEFNVKGSITHDPSKIASEFNKLFLSVA